MWFRSKPSPALPDLAQVKIGMNRAEVIEILGDPHTIKREVNRESDVETWTYGWPYRDWSYVVFRKGVVEFLTQEMRRY